MPPAADGAERLEQQRALAHARLAREQRDRAGDEPAAEHPVELARRRWTSARRRRRRPRRSAPGRDRDPDLVGAGADEVAASAEGAPRVALRAAPEPPWRLAPALGTTVDGLGLHVDFPIGGP